jgi:hypothetical protein
MTLMPAVVTMTAISQLTRIRTTRIDKSPLLRQHLYTVGMIPR